MLDRIKVTPENRDTLTASLDDLLVHRERIAHALRSCTVRVTLDGIELPLIHETELHELIQALREKLELTDGPESKTP